LKVVPFAPPKRCLRRPRPRGPPGRRAGVTYHSGDVDDSLHGLGFVDAAPQQALRVQAGLGVGVAEPGQERSLARHARQLSEVRGRTSDLGERRGGAGRPAAAAPATVTTTVTATVATAVTTAVAAASTAAPAAAPAAAATVAVAVPATVAAAAAVASAPTGRGWRSAPG
jgi:hypothetical protein